MPQVIASTVPPTPAKPATPAVDCVPAHGKSAVLGMACDALVRSQSPRPSEADRSAPANTPAKPTPTPSIIAKPANGAFRLDPHVIPLALFGVGGTGLGVYLMSAVHPLAGVGAIAVSMLVARAIAMSMGQSR
ncbi:MAG: hypothetical protein VKP62_12305 [Candidatus Sericytochromatia bacterium]|nr:hypothetical protein [Candidatus Sericytochromatia bacterium]